MERTQVDPGGTPQALELPPGKQQANTDLWRNYLPQMSSGTSTSNFHMDENSATTENTEVGCKFFNLCIILGVSCYYTLCILKNLSLTF